MALAALNRHQDALASYGRALALQPDNADVHFNAALSLLTMGDYTRGLTEYEWRWKRAGMGARKDLRKPLWLGETPLAGKTILLHAEQGLGDTVMFARYAPLLARAGARVVLEVQPELKGLLAGLEGVAAVVARGEPLPPFDVHCPLTSLPLACKTELSNVPADIPYLHASETLIAKWRSRLDGVPAPYVALAWSGRATHVNDRNRSLSLSQLEPLLEADDVRFVSIQHELRPADAEILAREPRIAHLGAELADFTDTAAVLALADLVICVDTSIAHVAGALGRPTWLLLPFQPDWRWTLERETSPWYPAHARCSVSPHLANGQPSSPRCVSNLHCGTSGSPPCLPTSPRGAGGTLSAFRQTAGRRCAATPRHAAPAAGWITDCSRERQCASGWCGSA